MGLSDGETATVEAFCPAHVTGFFKAHINDKGSRLLTLQMGSTGAGFSLRAGVTTRVTVKRRRTEKKPYSISVSGYRPDSINISETIVKRFLEIAASRPDKSVDVRHEIAVPVGYGLGSSGAVALSLAYALDGALRTNLSREEVGGIAHSAEIDCKTGLGDVLASFYGGFEVRTRPGAPGVGRVEKIPADKMSAVIICFAPISTSRFISQRLPQINGLGQKMVDRLQKTRDYVHFQNMSLEFARYVGVMTPRMQDVADELNCRGLRCGVALFGETLFCIVPSKSSLEYEASKIMRRHPGGIVIVSELDERGARILGGSKI